MVNSYTDVYGIIGNPVRHSLSPIMHNNAFKALGINAVYLAFEVKQVEEAIKGIKALGIKGVSITIPHKETVIPYLDYIDPTAEKIGAVNTIVNEDNILKGYNSDGIGAYNSIVEKEIDLNDKKVFIIGNGGTAKAIAYTLLDRAKLGHLFILGRNENRVNQFIANLKKQLSFDSITPFLDLNNPALIKAITESDVVINTSPVGMTPDDHSIPIDSKLIQKGQIVFDVVYKPIVTRLLSEAEQQKAITINGLEMLVNQGVVQFELWTKTKAPKELMYSSILNSLAKTML